MNKGTASSLSLIVKIIVILLIPLVMFRYVDSQPTTKLAQQDEVATRSIAVVNEDVGAEVDETSIAFGQEVAVLLNEQADYQWTVVNRSAAERGFADQKYDAILYVPSDFSKNVMSFKDESPKKASIDYVIQPNLEAKNRQRIHKEMAFAKNKINTEMATTYWNYVSQEMDHIREQFDTILEKEVAFQEAMHSFYTPSSKKLANEIEQLRDRFENIATQTAQMDDRSKASVDMATEAEKQMETFIEALEVYKETQQEQQTLLVDAQEQNKQTITNSLDTFHQAMESQVEQKEEQLNEISNTVVALENENRSLLNRMTSNIDIGKNAIHHWVDWKEQHKQTYTQLNDEIMQIINHYYESSLETAYQTMYEAVSDFQQSNLDGTWMLPIKPIEEEELSFEQLNAHMQQLETEITHLKTQEEQTNATPDPENVPDDSSDGRDADGDETPGKEEDRLDWSKVDASLQQVKEAIAALDSTSGNEDSKRYVEALEHLNEQLLSVYGSLKRNFVENIDEKQTSIVHLIEDEEKKTSLQTAFQQMKEKDKKTFTALLAYNDALTTYETTLRQQGPTSAIAKEVEALKINEKIERLFAQVKSTYTSTLQPIFGVDHNEIMTFDEQRESFTDQVNEVNASIDAYKQLIEKEQQRTNELLAQMEANVANISENMNELVANPFEWEESPSLEYLDGQMIFQTQHGAMQDLEQLSEMIASLGESQTNITESTETLQQNVGNVQNQSDELNNRWSVNVASTERVKEDVYDILGNTVVDGQSNPIVYDYLSNPVQVEGQTEGHVLTEEEDRLPPVILFIIILISGLLIGFLSHYYAGSSLLVQSALFFILTAAVGLIISVYGLNIYILDDAQSIKWSLITIILLLTCANIVRGSLFIGSFAGWIASIGMIVFFVTPMIDIVVPEFSFTNPIANVYMNLQYGNESGLYLTLFVLLAISVLISALIYGLQWMSNRKKVYTNEENAT